MEQGQDSQLPIFSLQDVTLKTGTNANDFFLHNVRMSIHRGQLVGVTGPVGCGKTTLMKALLGRLPVVEGKHVQRPDDSIMYCAQTPWIPSGTIRDAIIGQTPADENWYSEVIDACVLVEDFKSLDATDLTDVGSSGTNLSGGQKQRVVGPSAICISRIFTELFGQALARALFSRQRVFILDDILSGMDAHTTAHICRTVFGAEGIFRKLNATVIVTSHSRKQNYLSQLFPNEY